MTTPLTPFALGTDQARTRLHELTVIDVRTPAEYTSGHLPGALNIPVDRLRRAMPEIRHAAERGDVLVVCASGARSENACKQLAEQGIPTVTLAGDTGAWAADGRPPAAQGVARQPPRQARLRVAVLAQPAARPGAARHRLGHAWARQAPCPRPRLNKGAPPCPPPRTATRPVPVDDEGFFTDPDRWNEPMSEQIARETGIAALADRHWQVIAFIRGEYAAKGTGPTVRVLGRASGVSVKELYQLFPEGPAKTAAKIAGIPKPRGCS